MLKPCVHRAGIWFALCCLILCFSPCCAHRTTPPAQSVYRPCSPGEILPVILNANSPAALKGIAKVKVRSSDRAFSVKERISVQSPSSLRLETVSPLGHSEFYAVSDGKEVFLFVPSEKKFYVGSASPQTLSMFLPLSLGMEELIAIMLGRTPLIDYDSEAVSCGVTNDLYIIQLKAGEENLLQVVKVDVKTLTLRESGIYEQGENLTVSVQYDDYEAIGDVLFPRTIRIFMPRDETQVTISYRKLELLAEIDAEEFRLTAPQGAHVVPLK